MKGWESMVNASTATSASGSMRSMVMNWRASASREELGIGTSLICIFVGVRGGEISDSFGAALSIILIRGLACAGSTVGVGVAMTSIGM